MRLPLRAGIVGRGVRPMAGRNPADAHRTTTPLELLFDLAFVVAFIAAASESAHLLAEGHFRAATLGFGFAMFAVVWAWVNVTWFASAYDTDDWLYRLITLVQMAGVVVLALGLPAMFESFDRGDRMENRAMVIGYVLLRVPMVAQWMRAASHGGERRRCCYAYALTITVAQVLWVGMLFVDLEPAWWLVAASPLVVLEMAGPWYAERLGGGTPWHPHHIAERYGLLTIIALGEMVIGLVGAASAAIDDSGWTLDVVLLVAGGLALTFGMWWVYFLLPSGEVLARRRQRSFVWGYAHLLVFASIVAAGAGLHAVGLHLRHAAHIGATAALLTVAAPVALYLVVLVGLFATLVGLNTGVLVSTAVKLGVVAFAVALAASGIHLTVCLLVLALAPAAGVIVDEVGYGAPRRRISTG